MEWKVVPLCAKQLLDVDPMDVLFGGDFRKCDVYKSGGGYDQFPKLCENILGLKGYNLQFVVQLQGCVLECPYCYVTKEGIFGKCKKYSDWDLVSFFNSTPCNIFHLMGGAPAIYIEKWPHILEALNKYSKKEYVFYSDLLLVEKPYTKDILERIKSDRALYAISIKGYGEGFYTNTKRELDIDLFWYNLTAIEKSGINYYITFTNVNDEEYLAFWEDFRTKLGLNTTYKRIRQSLNIDLIKYNAIDN